MMGKGGRKVKKGLGEGKVKSEKRVGAGDLPSGREGYIQKLKRWSWVTRQSIKSDHVHFLQTLEVLRFQSTHH